MTNTNDKNTDTDDTKPATGIGDIGNSIVSGTTSMKMAKVLRTGDNKDKEVDYERKES